MGESNGIGKALILLVAILLLLAILAQPAFSAEKKKEEKNDSSKIKDSGPESIVAAAISMTNCSNASYLGSLSCGSSKIGSGSILSSGGTIWHKVYASSSGTLKVALSGPSSADFDLYVYSSCSSGYICRPYEGDSYETCTINATAGKYYYIGVNSYSGTGSYTVNASLSCSGGSTCNSTSYTSCSSSLALLNGASASNMCGSQQYYKITISNTCTITWTMTPGSSADYDLYARNSSGSCPSTSSYDCRPYSGTGTQETCTATLPAGTYYAMVNKYGGSGTYQIQAGYSNCSSTCSSHYSYSCYSNDVYWYNSCSQREGLKQDCGDSSCGGWGSNYCKNGDVYYSRACNDRGCSSSACYSTTRTDEQLVQSCGGNGCTSSTCNAGLNVTSYTDSIENDFLGNIQWETSAGNVSETGVYVSYKSDKSDAAKAVAPLNSLNKYAAILAPKYCSSPTLYARAYAIGTNGAAKYSDWKSISLAEYCSEQTGLTSISSAMQIEQQKEETKTKIKKSDDSASGITATAVSTAICSIAPFMGNMSCGSSRIAFGSLSSTGATNWHRIYATDTGTLTVSLAGPSTADFDLYTYPTCSSGWTCRPYSGGSNEICTVNATAESYYYIAVNSYSGTGGYSLVTTLNCAGACGGSSPACTETIIPFDLQEVDLLALGWAGIKLFTIGSCLDEGWLTFWCAFDVGSTAIILVPLPDAEADDALAIGAKLAKLAKGNKLLVEIGSVTKLSQAVRKIDVTVKGIKHSVAGSKIARAAELGIMQIDFAAGEIKTAFKELSEWLLKYGDSAIVRLKGLGATNDILEIVIKKGGNLDDTYKAIKRTDSVNVAWLDSYGWDYLSGATKNHHIQIQQAFGLSNSDTAVKDLIMDAVKTGVKDPADPYRIVKYYPEKNKNLRVIIRDLSDSPIKDAYPA